MDRIQCSECGRILYGGGNDWRDEAGSPFCWMNPSPQVHRPVVNAQ